MIWDLHAHLSGVAGRTPEERMAMLLKYADRMGVERLVVFMGLAFSTDPAPDDLARQNDEVLQALAHWQDRAFGFVYLNPNHPEASLRELERCVAEGPLVGVKLWVATRCDQTALDALIVRATELQAAIYQHTWYKAGGKNLPGESTPAQLAVLAARHPEARLICGHTGGDWERGIRAIRGSPNVWVDTGGCDPTAGMVEMAVRELGAGRVLYGSDVGGRSFASQLAKVQGAVISADQRRKILGENLRDLLTPGLERRGIKV